LFPFLGSHSENGGNWLPHDALGKANAIPVKRGERMIFGQKAPFDDNAIAVAIHIIIKYGIILDHAVTNVDIGEGISIPYR